MVKKRVLIAVFAAVSALVVALLFLFGDGLLTASAPVGESGSKGSLSASSKPKGEPASSKAETSSTAPVPAAKDDELRGMWITYFEIANLFDSKKGFEAAFNEMLDECQKYKVNALFVHVRSHCDAYYPSQYFPWSKYVSGIKGTQGKEPALDPLAYMLEAAHKRGMEFHAWINPYRVSYDSTDLALLADNNPAKIWLTDGDKSNDSWVVSAAGGLYLNPAVEQAQALVINGIREIVEKYDVDGIHFDDYFYPTVDESFDEKEYAQYRMNVWDAPLSLEDWRRANVNALVSRAYGTVKSARADCVFGISPMAAISTNYTTVFADVAAWVEGGYIDYIMPQLYFGFEYPKEENRFDLLLKSWEELTADSKAKLYIGLGAYRIGSTDENNVEWSQHSDLLARQVVCTRSSDKCNGFVLYSYSTFIVDDERHSQERSALLKVINGK